VVCASTPEQRRLEWREERRGGSERQKAGLYALEEGSKKRREREKKPVHAGYKRTVQADKGLT
jgi:hypothetical protein